VVHGFYAPWCGFCLKFEPIYESVAKEVRDQGVRLAKIDGDKHKDLAMRFQISGFPTIYHVHDGNVRLYDGGRTKEDLIQFVQYDYRNIQPLTFFSSPLSLFGKVIGFVAVGAVLLLDIFEKLRDVYGVSVPILIGAGILLAVLICLVTILVVDFLIQFALSFVRKKPASKSSGKSTKPTTKLSPKETKKKQ